MAGLKSVLINSKLAEPLRRYRNYAAEQREQKPRDHDFGFTFIGSDFNFDPAWEVEEKALFREQMPKHDVFIDIGSNQGIYSCLAAKLGLHVLAFEPLARNLTFLLTNVEANGFEVEVFPVALSDSCGVLPLYGDRDIASLERRWSDRLSQAKQMVPVNSLDAIVGDRFSDRKVLIKLDVEGFELSVLKGCSSILSRKNKPTWLIETIPQVGFGSFVNTEFVKLFELMRDNGYTCSALSGGDEIDVDEVKSWGLTLPERYSRGNFVFAPAAT